MRTALKLAGTRQGTGFTGGEDAGRIDYGRLRPRDLWALRVAIGEALSKAHPAPKTKLVDFVRQGASRSEYRRRTLGQVAIVKIGSCDPGLIQPLLSCRLLAKTRPR